MKSRKPALATRTGGMFFVTAVLLWMNASAVCAQGLDYRVVATNRTSTMEEEMNELASAGFRVSAVMGGETAFGGNEGVAIMYRFIDDPSAEGRYEYKLLATNRTSTMQEELQEAGNSGFEYVGQTIFRSTFGGQEVAVVLERDRASENGPVYEYLLLATQRTSTMQDELQEAGANRFSLVGMTVHDTAFGGNEVVAILRRVRE